MGEDRRAFSTFSVERSREICHATSLVFWAISSFLFGYVAAVMAASRDHPFLNELMCGNPSAEPTVGNKEWVDNHSWALCGDWRCHRRDSPQPFHEGCGASIALSPSEINEQLLHLPAALKGSQSLVALTELGSKGRKQCLGVLMLQSHRTPGLLMPLRRPPHPTRGLTLGMPYTILSLAASTNSTVLLVLVIMDISALRAAKILDRSLRAQGTGHAPPVPADRSRNPLDWRTDPIPMMCLRRS